MYFRLVVRLDCHICVYIYIHTHTEYRSGRGFSQSAGSFCLLINGRQVLIQNINFNQIYSCKKLTTFVLLYWHAHVLASLRVARGYISIDLFKIRLFSVLMWKFGNGYMCLECETQNCYCQRLDLLRGSWLVKMDCQIYNANLLSVICDWNQNHYVMCVHEARVWYTHYNIYIHTYIHIHRHTHIYIIYMYVCAILKVFYSSITNYIKLGKNKKTKMNVNSNTLYFFTCIILKFIYLFVF